MKSTTSTGIIQPNLVVVGAAFFANRLVQWFIFQAAAEKSGEAARLVGPQIHCHMLASTAMEPDDILHSDT
jgi:hypothetical protein